MYLPCGHLRHPTGETIAGQRVYQCAKHAGTTALRCLKCPDYRHRQPGFSRADFGMTPTPASTAQPEGIVVDRYGHPVHLADLYYGAQAFLVLGGPSLRTMPLEQLAQRGVLVISTNNCPACLPRGIRPHIWIHTDPPHKFHDSIWRDPSIIKFTPIKEWNPGRKGKKNLRHRDASGELVRIHDLPSRDCPGVFGYVRNSGLDTANFLTEASINRGNDRQHSEGDGANGMQKGINTMYSAIRLAFYLGVRTLYLLGADFHMTPDSPYSFDQGKGDAGVRGNNGAYMAMCLNFDKLQVEFLKHKFYVYNCTPGSHLWSFPDLPFEEAIRRATEHFEETLDCRGWYDPIPGPAH
jgi:hypothetical protein